jgi:hypothetical protein
MSGISTDIRPVSQSFPPVPEWRDVDPATFANEVRRQYRPAVLRGLVRDWPAVAAFAASPRAFFDYVGRFDRGAPVVSFIGDPAIKGRFWYREDMRGYNFERVRETYGAFVERLFACAEDPDPPSVYMGAAPVTECFPEFAAENVNALVQPSVVPRLWVGNAVKVSTHYDLSDNIACVIGGHRRVTLFPPDQLPNLYVGPLEFTLAGQPVSMVDLHAPDFDRYPRFREALAAAQVAELDPGDAIYIPTLWWHNIVSLDRMNAMVNYWWKDEMADAGSPFECLVHALISIRNLPEPERQAWRLIFDHYIFETGGDPVAHLKPEHQGVLGKLTPDLAKYIRSWLVRSLNR